MMHTIEQIRSMTDQDIIRLHDQAVTPSMALPQDLWLDELHRRDQVRSAAAMERLARQSFRLTWANSVLALVAATAAVIALLR
jgi:hypothetical protein